MPNLTHTLLAGAFICGAALVETARQAIRADVENKRVPGAVLLVGRNGRIVGCDAISFQDRASRTPMKKDSIFRIASLTKPVTTVVG